jgi:hypothetical protein
MVLVKLVFFFIRALRSHWKWSHTHTLASCSTLMNSEIFFSTLKLHDMTSWLIISHIVLNTWKAEVKFLLT